MTRNSLSLRVLALATVATLALTACQPGQTAATAPPRPVRAQTVVLAPPTDATRYAAVIKPRIEADLGFRVAGKVAARLVDVGRRVEAGQALARLDPADLELQVRAARAQLAAAKADADNARIDFDRYQKLKQGEWTTTQERDRRKTLLEKADAHVREVEASLNVLLNSLQYATLNADGPGVVTATLVEPGQVVAAGQPAIRVAREGEMEAVANIPEHRLAGLADKRLMVELWSLPGVEIKARLREVSPMADAGVRTFQSRVTLIDPPADVQLGMTATLTAYDDAAAPVARLPLTALTQSEGKPAVWVVDGVESRLALRPVTVAAYAGDDVLIAAGLANGEKVATAGTHKLTAGEKVRLWVEAAR
jgi:membrane fusion protein, multidrug efflux system